MEHSPPHPCSPANAGAQTGHPPSRVNILLLTALATLFIALALLRPADHDESQYVAAAVLTAHGLLPYRDFAYLQTPLQPFVLAPIAVLTGAWTWPALRLTNALLGLATVAFVHAAARRTGAGPATARLCAALFATTDILLFSIGTARNDALPAACLAAALWLILREDRTRAGALTIGLLLAAAVAAKISYAFPAAAYGLYALAHPRHRVWLVALGAVPVVAFVGWTFALSPEGFLFGTLHFPAQAPAEYYAARPWKLSLAAKALDTLKFLALGAALPALVLVARAAIRRRRVTLPDLLVLAGLVAALLPVPTWRQYLLPMLPPLFVALAAAWTAQPPTRATTRIMAVFALLGLAPTLSALVEPGRLSLVTAMREAATLRRTLDARGIAGPIVTLSPQILPATGRLPDARFAAGPFYFRSRALLDAAAEVRLHLVARDRLRLAPGTVILTGGESAATAGDRRLDAALEKAASGAVAVPGTRFRLSVTPPAAPVAPRSARHNSPPVPPHAHDPSGPAPTPRPPRA